MEKMNLFRVRAISNLEPVETYISIPGGWTSAYDVVSDLSKKMKRQDSSWRMLGLDFVSPLTAVDIEDLRWIRSGIHSASLDTVEEFLDHIFGGESGDDVVDIAFPDFMRECQKALALTRPQFLDLMTWLHRNKKICFWIQGHQRTDEEIKADTYDSEIEFWIKRAPGWETLIDPPIKYASLKLIMVTPSIACSEILSEAILGSLLEYIDVDTNVDKEDKYFGDQWRGLMLTELRKLRDDDQTDVDRLMRS